MKVMNFSKTALRNLFSKPATTEYPFVKKEYPEGTRGFVEIDIDACILCGMCARKCPSNVITVNKEKNEWVISPFGCISCANCVIACPKKCLSMNKQYTSPDTEKNIKSFVKKG